MQLLSRILQQDQSFIGEKLEENTEIRLKDKSQSKGLVVYLINSLTDLDVQLLARRISLQ